MSAVFLPIMTAVALLTVISLSIACGEDELTLETYFQRLEGLDADTERKSKVAAAQMEDQFEKAVSVSEKDEALDKFVSAFIPILLDYTTGLGDLNPPSEAQDAHDAHIAAFRAAIEELENFAGKFSQAQSEEDFEPLGQVMRATFDDVGDTCSKLKTVATTNNIAVGLDCQGRTGGPLD